MSKTLSHPRPFGLAFSGVTTSGLVELALSGPRPATEGVGLVVTPNIEHIALLRRTRNLAIAYDNAAMIVCDGWPVHLYVRARGLAVERVTGCDLAVQLMGRESYGPWARFFFVVDREETARALHDWALRKGIADNVVSFVPPFGFEHDEKLCRDLAQRIRDHGTTVLMMGVGAPRSEVFVDRYRALLPACWAFCVGQAVKVALGLVRRAPVVWQKVGMEWLWRICQEPRRLASRYARSSVGFALAMLEDRWRHGGTRPRSAPGQEGARNTPPPAEAERPHRTNAAGARGYGRNQTTPSGDAFTTRAAGGSPPRGPDDSARRNASLPESKP